MTTLKFAVAMALNVTMLAGVALSTNHTVGAPTGSWDMSTTLNAWASFQTFVPGDTLVFSYVPIVHDVVEVPKSDYDACQVTNPISSHNDGYTTIPLDAIGKRYFICGVPGHCDLGMKIAIKTVAPGSRQHPPAALTPAGSPGRAPSDTPANTGNLSLPTGTLGYSSPSPPAPPRPISAAHDIFSVKLAFVASSVALVFLCVFGL